MLNSEQVEYISSMKFINKIDEHVKVLAEYDVRFLPSAQNVIGKIILILNVFYNGDKITELSFNLQNYNYEELLEVAKDIKSNEFIMYELDQYLSGDIE